MYLLEDIWRYMEGTEMIDAPVHQKGKKWFQDVAFISDFIMVTRVGTILAWTCMYFVLPQLYEPDSWLVITKKQPNFAACEGFWMSVSLALGAILGAIPSGPMADKIGRKKSLLLLTTPFLLFWVIIIFASELWLMNIARFILGIGVGATCVLIPTYTSEIAENFTYGTRCAKFYFFLKLGIVFTLACVLGAVLSYTAFAIICALVEIGFFAVFTWMPESPVWLRNKKWKTEATLAMADRGDSYDPSE